MNLDFSRLASAIVMACLAVLAMGSDAEAASSVQPAHPDFVIGVEDFPASLDPRSMSFLEVEQAVENLLFLPLFTTSVSGEPTGVVAEKVRLLSPTRLEIVLRQGIQFALGREITPHDVVASYRAILAEGDAVSPRAKIFSNILSIQTGSKRSVIVRLKQPDSSLLGKLTVGILPKEAIEREGAPLTGQGFESGPFVLSQFAARDIVLTRNEKYTGAPFAGPLPMVGRVRFKLFGSRQAIFDALLAGELDLVQNALEPLQLSELKSKHSARFEVQQVTADETWFLGFNVRKKPFSDVRVRRAIALAIDRKEVLKFSLMGRGVLAKAIFPPKSLYHPSQLDGLTANEREARILLDATKAFARRSDPGNAPNQKTQTHFKISVPLDVERIAIAKGVAGQLKRVGLNVGIEVSEHKAFAKKLDQGEVDTWIAPWAGFKDGDFLRFAFHSEQAPPTGGNVGFYANKQLDQILDKALRVADTAQRKALYDQAQAIIAEDFPYAFLWHGLHFSVVNRTYRGFQTYPDARLNALSHVRKR